MVATALFCALSLAMPHAWVLERPKLRSEWQVTAADAGQSHEVIVAVEQRNLEELEATLLAVSSPGSPRRGQYLSFSEAHRLTANPEAAERVEQWLASEPGVELVGRHAHGHFFRARASVGTWERALRTKFARLSQGKVSALRAVEDVHIPDHLNGSVAAMMLTSDLPWHRPPVINPAPQPGRLRASQQVTPTNLLRHYKISGQGSANATQSVAGMIGQTFSPSDLRAFQQQFKLPQHEVARTRGGHVDDGTCIFSPNDCAEANLDVQYMMAASPQSATTWHYTDDQLWDWLYEVASDPSPALVHSISYGISELALTKALVRTFDVEAQKLGLQGVSLFAASGDDGALDRSVRSLGAAACGYAPTWPASSPWVTAVGATQGGVTGGEEVACASDAGGDITTGGGFSLLYDTPAWQRDAVQGYVSQTSASDFRAGGRGYPDVALAGNGYAIVVGGRLVSVSGTSASSPSMAGIASTVNARLLGAGKPPLGFLNPSIYSGNSSAFRDITSGNNRCAAPGPDGRVTCCEEGFEATQGWDPVTGFGVVDYEAFYELFTGERPPAFELPGPMAQAWQWLSENPVVLAGIAAFALLLLWSGLCGLCCRRKRGSGATTPLRQAQV